MTNPESIDGLSRVGRRTLGRIPELLLLGVDVPVRVPAASSSVVESPREGVPSLATTQFMRHL